ncbi:hypothetical protein B7463_g10223, partial [Scytalidium lignicola]
MAFPPWTKITHHDVYPSIDPSNPALSIKGKVIIITGGSRGIGKATAFAFAKAGAKAVVITGRTEKTLQDVTDEITRLGAKARYFIADVVNKSQIQEVFTKTKAEFGSIGVVVSNAGYLPDSASIRDVDINDWWKTFEINTKGAFIVTQAFVQHADPGASLINVNSAVAHVPHMGDFSSYGASKLASLKIAQATQSEHPELRVFSIQPGLIDTETSSKSSVPGEDTPELPASFMVWLATPETDFLKGRMVWANWDVEELKQRIFNFKPKMFNAICRSRNKRRRRLGTRLLPEFGYWDIYTKKKPRVGTAGLRVFKVGFIHHVLGTKFGEKWKPLRLHALSAANPSRSVSRSHPANDMFSTTANAIEHSQTSPGTAMYFTVTRCDTKSPRCSRCEKKQVECVYDGVTPQGPSKSKRKPLNDTLHTNERDASTVTKSTSTTAQNDEQSELFDWSPDLLSFTGPELSFEESSSSVHTFENNLFMSNMNMTRNNTPIWALGLLEETNEGPLPSPLISTSLSNQRSTTPILLPTLTYHDTSRVFKPRTFSSTSARRSSSFMIRVLRSYPRMMLRSATFPPFIHPYCGTSGNEETNEPILTEPLAISKSANVVLSQYLNFDKWEILAGMQALLLYILMRIIEGNAVYTNSIDVHLLFTLKALCSHLHSLYPDCLDDPSHAFWEDWIFFESRRRTSVVFLLVNMLVDLELGLPAGGCKDIGAAPLPSMRTLWESHSRSSFQREYDACIKKHSPGATYGDLLRWRMQNEGWDGDQNGGLDEWCSSMDDLGMVVLAAAALF